MSFTTPTEIKSRGKILLISVVSSFLALFPTFYVAAISGSVTLYADLLHSVSDFTAITVSWVIFRRIGESIP